MPKFAANLSFLFNEVSFLERFAKAKQARFDAVEFAFAYDYHPDVVARALQENALQNVLINAPSGDWEAGDRGLAAMPGREHEFIASMTTAFRYANAFSCPRVHVMAGVVRSDADAIELARYRATYVRNLRIAAQEAAVHDITLLIEPINRRDMPGYFLTRQDEAHAVREEVGAPNLQVQMDLYHAQVVEGDLSTKLQRYMPHIGHIQVASVPGRNEPNVGEVNYSYLFTLIDALGYDGWIGCEYRPATITAAGLKWLNALQ